ATCAPWPRRPAAAPSHAGRVLPLSEVRERASLYHRLHARPAAPDAADGEEPPLAFPCAQLAGVYVLAANRDGLIVVDMHAAHERITYERLKRDLETHTLKSQALLVPVSVAVGATEADLVEECAAELESLGFLLVRRGPTTISVAAIPLALEGRDVEPLLRDLLSDLAAGPGRKHTY